LDGQRFLGSGEAIQRFLCKVCGLRFSEEHKVLNKIKTNGKRRVCDLIEESKNLAEPQIKGLAGVTDADLKGLLTIYMAKAEHQGHAETTIHRNIQNLTWLAAHANLDNPVEVWVAIENQKQWKNGTKQITASAYKHFRKTFNKPIPQDLNFTKWVMSERIPYVPTERELLDLIANSNYRIAPFLRLLFETGMRSGEAWALKWTDFDLEKKIVTLNAENVEKHGKPRQFKLSDQLIAMLNRLPKKTQTVWCGIKSLKVLRSSFSQQRRRLAYKLQNLKLTKITLHTFRHFYATKLYHSTKDILLVKERLGHRNIQSTMVYTSLVEWDEPDKWTVRRPSTTKEEDELLEAGFEYVRFDDKLNVPIYRKRK
jgi:site-specific recombinase XerD